MQRNEHQHEVQHPFQTSITPGASLMLAFRPIGRKILVLGTRRLAASRIVNILEADAIPVLIGIDCSSVEEANEEVRWRVKSNQCTFVQAPQHDSASAWSSLLDGLDEGKRSVFAVCVCDTLHAGDEESRNAMPSETKLSPLNRAKLIVQLCQERRIPVNVADHPELCDFTFPASHRFPAKNVEEEEEGKSGSASSLQIAVTTNGRGCRLATRIRREIVSSLPRNVGDAVERIGDMREMAKGRQERKKNAPRQPSLRRKAFGDSGVAEEIEEEDLSFDTTPINSPVPQIGNGSKEGKEYISAGVAAASERLMAREAKMMEERKRRMRWVAQMSEYWPITFLGSLKRSDMAKALETYSDEGKDTNSNPLSIVDEESTRGRDNSRAGVQYPEKRASSQHSLAIPQPMSSEMEGKGHIYLVGSGPGHPGLLTAMAHRLLTSKETDIVLSDKLVPSPILSLIPKHITLHIARKFPGNAEGAQSELIALALEAAKQGKRVVRLKQGDPFVYGRGGEEVLAFAREDIRTTIIPGISSALAAPLLVNIPVTQRGAADSLTLCTGVGRGGKNVRLPGYERSRSLVILMGVARLHDVVKTLCHGWQSATGASGEKRIGSGTSEKQINPGTSEKQIKSGTSSSGVRLGMPFPPYTPIAIVERASSTDQRMVASTLEGIEKALASSGEQRPPGMMLVGWTTMALDGGGNGNVDILDDEDKLGEDIAMLEKADRERVERWLGKKGYIIREGLDDAYTRELSNSSSAHAAQAQDDGGDRFAEDDVVETSARGPSGWAPPRYGIDGIPRGGWGEGEKSV